LSLLVDPFKIKTKDFECHLFKAFWLYVSRLLMELPQISLALNPLTLLLWYLE